MASGNCFQPMLNVQLPSLASALNSLGKISRAVNAKEVKSKGVRTTSNENESESSCSALVAGISKLLETPDLVQQASVVELSFEAMKKRNHLLDAVAHSVSASTFFENINGFPESILKTNVQSFTNTFKPNIMITLQNNNSANSGLVNTGSLLSRITKSRFSQGGLFYDQRRGFKTKRSHRITGLGRDKPAASEENTFPAFKLLRNTVFDKTQSSAGLAASSSEKLRSLLSDTDPSTQQDRLKIAFAEGYMAGEHKGGPGTGSTVSPLVSFAKKVMKFLFIAFGLWLTIQIIQAYAALGGNMKINVLKGEKFEVNPEHITVTFNDVKGIDEAKEELTDVVDYLRNPEKFTALGAKLPKGVLLVGQPGIGKSLLARAVAGEAGVPFFYASGSEFDEVFVGTGAKRVRQLFDAAKARAPCIVFIDEIDTVGAKRTSSQIHPYANQTINQLLAEMDGFEQTEGVIVLGATNRRDNLDKALLRPGRFDVEVRVFPPDLKGRKDILEHYLSKVKIDGTVDVDKLARGTTGCTGADLENMVNQAALKAAMDEHQFVGMSHMEYARDKVLMGPAKKFKIPDEETNLITAYHEAGHTLVAYYTKDATPINKVTIIPRGTSLGHTSFVPDKEEYNFTKAQLLAQMDVSMGGRVAEEIIYGNDKVTTGASSDFQSATAIATAMVKRWGMSEKVGVRVLSDGDVDTGISFLRVNDVGPGTTDIVDNEIKRLLQESYDRAKVILKTHQAEHKQLAQALMKHETLTYDDIKALVEGKGFGSS